MGAMKVTRVNVLKNTRVKILSRKNTIDITLPRNLIKLARKHQLNISRISEQALNSILDYLDTQNTKINPEISSDFLDSNSFLKEVEVPRAGFELTTDGDITRNFPFFVL